MRATLTHLWLSLAALLWLTTTAASAQAPAKAPQPPAPQETFTQQARKLLTGPWTQLYISRAEFDDVPPVMATAIELRRDKVGGAIRLREVCEKPAPYQPLSAEKFQQLSAALLTAAAEVEEEVTPGEFLSTASPQEVARLIEEGQVKAFQGACILCLHSHSPTGSAAVHNDGKASTWKHYCEKELHLTDRPHDIKEIKAIVGFDFYEDAE